jgi:hypothetical protein
MRAIGTVRKRPGMAFLGYAVALLPLVGVLAAFHTKAFAGLGWHGGQYAKAFLAGTAVAVLGGAALRAWQPGSVWRSVGHGVLLAGVTGAVLILIFLIWVGYAVSHMTFV